MIEFLKNLAEAAFAFFKVSAECPPVALAVFGYALVAFHKKTGEWYNNSSDFYAYFVVASVVSASASYIISKMIWVIQSTLSVTSGFNRGIVGSFTKDPIAFVVFFALWFALIYIYFIRKYAKANSTPSFSGRYREAFDQVRGFVIVLLFTAFVPTYVSNELWLAMKPSPAEIENPNAAPTEREIK